ncbi:sugar phosphate isomerase/epimerase [Saccharopolyspora gloriosae]|uniref:sugar phosphate isomerase/epimerase family protein n=1 Tax=Saccharopolyspora gloriosae TaxID=455344 RepID=UPI001FB6E999|nr:sugar phosphate isomerase/epimerase [Saccharopolyspora gloriosae]
MTIGLSTYAYFWQWSDHVPRPLSLIEMLADTARQGVELFQICDYPPLESMSDAELDEVRGEARRLGVRLELGTRGLRPAHLRRYLELAGRLDATLVRSMMRSADSEPTLDEAEGFLREVVPEYAAAGVTIALETYEQVPTPTLVELVERIADPHLGICLDPANVVAALELPEAVVDLTAPHVVNVHVKDFAFTRSPGWVGFQLTGAPLGTGQLDRAHEVRAVRADERDVNEVIEHWLPWQGDAETTCAVEREWTAHNLDYLRSERT